MPKSKVSVKSKKAFFNAHFFVGVFVGILVTIIAFFVYTKVTASSRVTPPPTNNACEDACYAAYQRSCPVVGGFCPESYARIYYACKANCK
jgi:hypothetical protein